MNYALFSGRLSNTEQPIDNLIQHGLAVQDLPAHIPGSIVFRLNVHGILGVEIITDQSDEENAFRQRLTTARPTLEVLRRMFIVNPLTGQEIQ